MALAWDALGPFVKGFFLAVVFVEEAGFLLAGLFIFATMPKSFLNCSFSSELAAAAAASLPSLLLRKEGSAIALA